MWRNLLLLLALTSPAWANDGFGGLSATGLTFGQTEAVAMVEEDLFISPSKVKVAYVFENRTSQDVTGEVIFPLPPIGLAGLYYSPFNLPEDVRRENFLNFHAMVDGVEVPVTLDRIAVIEPPWEENRPSSEQYDTPGRDVTADLAALNIPLSVDLDEVTQAIVAGGPATIQALTAKGLLEYYPAEGDSPEQIVPLWSVVMRYHWTQSFPAGQKLTIAHEYDNLPSGGLMSWEDPLPDYMAEYEDRYCVDAGTSRALAKATAYTDTDGNSYSMGSAYMMSYVLRTANSWAGPIEKFRLTVDKAAPENVVSLCADGIKKVGPTSFVWEQANFSPEQDLEIMVMQPIPRQ
jgi:hypothetical protein